MKKILVSLFLGLVLFSCTDEPMIETLDSKQIYYFRLNSRDWKRSTDDTGLNSYYHATFNIRGLNDLVFDKGAILAYLDNGDYQQILPYVRHYENTEGVRWTKTIDYDFEVGKITFYVTYSDFAKEQPEGMSFKVILMR